jgi:hypothetical protein
MKLLPISDCQLPIDVGDGHFGQIGKSAIGNRKLEILWNLYSKTFAMRFVD